MTVNNVHPSLIFAGKSCSLSLVRNLKGKYETRVEVTDSDKQPGKTNRRGRLSTIDLLIKVACVVKKQIMFTISK
jgi:hypothetical protein